MWRADRQHDDDDDGTSSVAVPTGAPGGAASPGTVSLGDPGLAVGNVAEPSRTGWRDQLGVVGGTSTLLHFGDEQRARI